MRHVYADAVGRIEFMHGVVKLELVSFKPGTGDLEGAFDAAPCQCLVMVPETLARLHGVLQALEQQLFKEGILARTNGEAAA